MGKKDLGCKILLDLNDVFADIVNVLMFKNKEVLKPDELVSTGLESQFHADGSYHEQRRDVAKLWEKCGIRIAFFGIENEREATREMPLRILSYDGGVYRSQIKDRVGYKSKIKDRGIYKSQIKAEDEKNVLVGEVKDKGKRKTKNKIISKKDKNLCKKDKVRKNKRREYYPVISLVLNFNTERRWSAPKRLKEVVSIPKELEPFVNDYRINVVDVAFLDREVIDSFKSEFWFVADYFWQIRNNKDYKPSDKRIEHAHEVLQMMSAVTGDNSFERVYNEVDEKQGGNGKMSEYISRIVAEGERRGEQKGERRGKRAERENAIRVLVQSAAKLGADDKKISEIISEEYGLTAEKAMEKVEKYRLVPA